MNISKVLKFINDGKVYAIITAITTYLVAKSWIGTEEVVLIGTISSILFGVASYQTKIDSLKSELAASKNPTSI